MGKELEYKLRVGSSELLEKILSDAELCKLIAGTMETTQMKTTYYDTPERLFSLHRFTLRQRFEGNRSVVCLKTPLKESHARGEWEISAERIDEDAIAKLTACGAPSELAEFYASGSIEPVCGAEFVRKHVMLRFADGSTAEIAGDQGILHGQTEKISFVELELELLSGEKDLMITLVNQLCEKYGLHEEPMSKFARARMLK